MMMKRTNKNFGVILAAAFFVFAISACESILFIELEEGERLIVVNGMLATDSTAAVQVSRTRHILDNASVEPLANATVRLYEDGKDLGELTYTENAWYVLDGFTPLAGRKYSLEVEHAGYPAVSATTDIPATVPVGGLDTATVTIEYDDGYGWVWTETALQFDLSMEDPGGEDNYYLLSAEVDRSWTEFRDTTVKVVDSLWYNGQWNYFLEDSTYTIEDVHYYTSYPYIQTEDIVLEAATSHGILFSDRLFEGKAYSFRGGISDNELRTAEPSELTFYLKTVSEGYYKYLKSRQKHYDTKENFLAVPVIVYNNVADGAGFLGGYSADAVTITTFIPEFVDDSYYYYYE